MERVMRETFFSLKAKMNVLSNISSVQPVLYPEINVKEYNEYIIDKWIRGEIDMAWLMH